MKSRAELLNVLLGHKTFGSTNIELINEVDLTLKELTLKLIDK